MTLSIYYDGDCPFCSNYVGLAKLRENVGRVRLVNLRDDPAALAEITTAGIDPDLGMVVDYENKRHVGQDAVTLLSNLSSRDGWLNRLSAGLMSNPMASRFAYPFLRAGRNLTLTMLGRAPIQGEDAAMMAKLKLFSAFFGVFTIFHVMGYLLRYRIEASWDLLALGVAGACAVLFPGSIRVFLALFAMSMLSGWLQAPVQSNHTFLRNVVAFGFLVIYTMHLLRGSRFSQVFADFSLLGGASLIVMYFFGIFHKINTDFLDPAVSCATTLWALMPPPLRWIDHPLMDQAAIYGTFLVEGVLLLALMTVRFRYLAILGGMAFHAMLALTNYSMYIPFTALSITLHVLFVSPQAAARITASPLASWVLEARDHPIRIALFGLVIAAGALATRVGFFLGASLAAGFLLVPLCLAIALYGREKPGERFGTTAIGNWATAFIASGFFLSCLTPYMGLRSSQSMNMFANLRLEGGISNHLVFSNPPSLFPYMSDVVKIHAATQSRRLEALARGQRLLPYYALLHELERAPQANVSFSRNGGPVQSGSAASMASEIAETLHSPILRKYIQFRATRDETPQRCL